MLKREAIIFIPGIKSHTIDQSLNCITKKIKSAVDKNVSNRKLIYSDKSLGNEEYGLQNMSKRYSTEVRNIFKIDENGNEIPLIDLYMLDYHQTLTQEYENYRLIKKILILIFTLMSNFKTFFVSLFSNAKIFSHRFQSYLVIGIFYCLLFYLIILLVSLVSGIYEILIAVSQKYHIFNFNFELSSAASDTIGVFKYIVILLTSMGFINKFNFKEYISESAVNLLMIINYLTYSEKKFIIIEQVCALLEHISEKETEYDKVCIIGYSFGSIISIDVLHQFNNPPKTIKIVNSLITIGCPFDILKAYWPDYFENRKLLAGHKFNWINIYSPIDVLGSEFKEKKDKKNKNIDNDKKTDKDIEKIKLKPDTNIEFNHGIIKRKLNLLDYIFLFGITIHSKYWRNVNEPDINAFDLVVQNLIEKSNIIK